MALLELENITKRFNGLLAIDRVSLKIAPGEIVGIVGPNGSGKTTLFNLISGIYPPEEGKVFFMDRDITALPAYSRAKLGIGRTFQIPRPFNTASVRENVATGAMFGAQKGKISLEEAFFIADRYIDLLGLKAHKEKMASDLTPVERKLMELARTLSMEPVLLLLDEVMAGMPPGEVDHLVTLIKEISVQEEIAGVAMVEHIMRAVTGLAERVIVMNRGSILCDAPVDQALNDPRVVECYLGKIEEHPRVKN